MRATKVAAMALAITGAVPAAAAEPIEVMVLGTYHFDNPGRDIHNIQAEDVLTPERQAELRAVAEAIAAFRPTRIMIERVAKTPDLVDPNFAAFTPAQLSEQRDERVQIAYRIAHDLKLDKVYAIDEQSGPGEPDYFPFGKVMTYAKAHGQEPMMDALLAASATMIKEFEAKQAVMSIADLLAETNASDGMNADMRFYYDLLAVGDPDEQPGAELNAMWYLRNAKIFSKLRQLAEPGDRVLVVYGAGHSFWLRHFAEETPGFRSVDPVPYLKAAAEK
jgi:hypothetical protein